jgi:DNA-binding LytR/AlgR family response regulator
MLTAIALDDEPIALEVIKSLSKDIAFIELSECFTNSFKAIEYLQKNKVDLIFLDIKMPNISGIDFLRSLTQPPMVIFTTAYSEHAVQSFELNAIDYLLKPFSQARFLKACNKAYEQYQLRKQAGSNSPDNNSIFIKSGYDYIRLNLDEILYAESRANYVEIVMEDKRVASRLTMIEAAATLPTATFVRIHRSFIVAKKRITKIEKKSVWLNTIELPIGSGYFDEIMKTIK